MVLERAFGSGVNDPLMDVGEVWTIDGAAGVASGVAATATLGRTRITPIANTKVVEIRRTGPRSRHLTAPSLSRISCNVPSIRPDWVITNNPGQLVATAIS